MSEKAVRTTVVGGRASDNDAHLMPVSAIEEILKLAAGNIEFRDCLFKRRSRAAEYFGIKAEDIDAKDRTKKIATARQIAMFVSREMTNASLPKIGEGFGGRDHTTVLHAFSKIKAELKGNVEIGDAVKQIRNTIKKFTPKAV